MSANHYSRPGSIVVRSLMWLEFSFDHDLCEIVTGYPPGECVAIAHTILQNSPGKELEEALSKDRAAQDRWDAKDAVEALGRVEGFEFLASNS